MNELKTEKNAKQIKKLMTIAAMFREQFSLDWLIELSGMKPTEILAIFEEAIGEGWILNIGPGLYRFADIKRQMYFLATRDPGMHRKIADIMIRDLEPNGQNTLLIAHHLLHVTNNLDSVRWLIKAGDLFLQEYNYEEALSCYVKILEDLAGTRGMEADSVFIAVTIKYSKLSTAAYNTQKVRDILKEAIGRATNNGDDISLALLQMHYAKNEWLSSNYAGAFKHFNRGWTVARETSDPGLHRAASTFTTFFLYWQGRYREAVSYYEKSIHDVEKFPHGKFSTLTAILVGLCYAYNGQVTQALGMLDSIRSGCEERGDTNLVATTESTMGSVLLFMGRKDEAIATFKNALAKMTQKTHALQKILLTISLVYAFFLKNDYEATRAHLEQYRVLADEVNFRVQIHPFLMEISWAIEVGAFDAVPDLKIEAEIEKNIAGENIFLKGVAYRYHALLQKKKRESREQVILSFERSIELLEESGHKTELGKSKMGLARFLNETGNTKKAAQLMKEAAAILSPINDKLIPDELRGFMESKPLGEILMNEMVKVGQDMVGSRDGTDISQHIISIVNRITGAERGAIFLVNPADPDTTLQLRASKNLTLEQVRSSGFQESINIIRQVAGTRKGAIVNISEETANRSTPGNLIQSIICVPMEYKGEVVGVLYHDNRLINNTLEESSLDLLSYFGTFAAIALDNVKAHQEIKMLNEKLLKEKQYFEEEHIQELVLDDIIGESRSIRGVKNRLERVAKTESTVLILGETGVGKELVATAIHRNSLRRDKSFIRVNCSALTESLIPSELFGHEKGAFTGAIEKRIGRFELANSGTLLLDEIGDLSLDVQVRLLRILQTKEFERVGGSQTIRSDFRLIAATSKNLEQEVEAGRFREDLFYRLNIFPIEVPPLRKRKTDIPLLAAFFLEKYQVKLRIKHVSIPDAEMQKLKAYDWPGNIREFENIIERGLILSQGMEFTVPESLSSRVKENGDESDDLTLAEAEKRHIIRVLEKTNWRVKGKQGAARRLDMNPSTLSFRMKKLNITRPA